MGFLKGVSDLDIPPILRSKSLKAVPLPTSIHNEDLIWNQIL